MSQERMECALIKVEGGAKVRTSEVVGFCYEVPKVGQRFTMYGTPIDPSKDVRMVSTSRVRKIENIQDGSQRFMTSRIFTTTGSVYEVVMW